MSRFIGMFAVDQRRKRQLYTDRYSHVLVVFDTALILVEAAPVRDYGLAAWRRVPVPVPHATAARTLLRLTPRFGSLKKSIAQLGSLTPEILAAAYRTRARLVWNDRIRSAVLTGTRRADLKIEYESATYGRPMELWFTISFFEDGEQVRAALATTLGARFRAKRRNALAAVSDAWSPAQTAGEIGHDLAGRPRGSATPPAS
ncbi:MAG TPA: hypothetical protein VFP78_05220 [Solirubrobacteraceae bacterium]|nr:hypothetical protein [Solirubrobacteraceae bacterium]